MYNTTSRFFESFTRAGLFVALAASILALTPRVASAGVIICVGGQCQWGPGNCTIWKPLPAGYLCADIATSMLRNPNLARNGDGASITIDGKTTPIMSDVLAAKGDQMGKPGGMNQEATVKLLKEFDTAFRSSNRKVSDDRLKSFREELKLPIEPKLKN